MIAILRDGNIEEIEIAWVSGPSGHEYYHTVNDDRIGENDVVGVVKNGVRNLNSGFLTTQKQRIAILAAQLQDAIVWGDEGKS